MSFLTIGNQDISKQLKMVMGLLFSVIVGQFILTISKEMKI
jgi:hypothetical protein